MCVDIIHVKIQTKTELLEELRPAHAQYLVTKIAALLVVVAKYKILIGYLSFDGGRALSVAVTFLVDSHVSPLA